MRSLSTEPLTELLAMFLAAALLGIIATITLVAVVTGAQPKIKVRDPFTQRKYSLRPPSLHPAMTRGRAISEGNFEHISLDHVPKKQRRKVILPTRA